MYKKNMMIYLMCLFFISCTHRTKIQYKVQQDYQEIVAKFADMPDSPFQAKLDNLIISDQCHDQVQIFYSCLMPKLDMIHFYQQQMERLGWELLGQSDIHDCLLCYSKPELLCCIIIRKDSIVLYRSKKGA